MSRCFKNKKKNKNLTEQPKDREPQNDVKNERENTQKSSPYIHVESEVDEGNFSPDSQGKITHSYQGYGMVSYPKRTHPHKAKYSQNKQKKCSCCMDSPTVSPTDNFVSDCTCTKEYTQRCPECLCTSGDVNYPPNNPVTQYCPCMQNNMVHPPDSPCLPDTQGDVDGTPTRCHLNLTIVNRGEFCMERRRDKHSSRPFRRCYQEMKQYYQQQQIYLQEQHAQCFQQLLDMLQLQEQMEMQKEYKPSEHIPPPGYPTATYPPPSNGEVLYDDVVNGTRITISGTPLNNQSLAPRVESPQVNLNKIERGGFNLHIAVTPQPDADTRAAAKQSLQEEKKKKYCC